MVLRGVLERAFGNILCLRGFAKLGELAEISAPDDNYQRPVSADHADEITDFLVSGEYTFFPELILGVSLSRIGLTDSDIQALYDVVDSGKAMKFSGATVSISTFVRTYQNIDFPRHVTASFYGFEKIVGSKPLSRIDGNHRLEAVGFVDEVVKKYNAPFCLALFRNDDECHKFGTVFFHNINYRARPIPEEQNLKVILESKDAEDAYVFTDETLETKGFFGRPYLYTRKVLEWIDVYMFPYLDKVIKDSHRTILLRVFELLSKDEPPNVTFVDKVVRALPKVETLVEKHGIEQCSVGVAAAMIYFAVKDRAKCADAFVAWVKGNDLLQVGDVNAQGVVSYFERTHKRGPYKVFVAMPYVSHAHVNEYNKLFKEVLEDELSDPQKRKDGVEYELIPIMRFRGASDRIDQRLIKKIKECDIFIADITGNNENVVFEVGLAEGNGKPKLLIRADNDDKADKVFIENVEYVKSGGHVPFDMDKLQYIPYSATGYYNSIKNIVRNNIPEIVKGMKECE